MCCIFAMMLGLCVHYSILVGGLCRVCLRAVPVYFFLLYSQIYINMLVYFVAVSDILRVVENATQWHVNPLVRHRKQGGRVLPFVGSRRSRNFTDRVAHRPTRLPVTFDYHNEDG